MIVRYLVDVPEAIPTLAAAFQADAFAHPDDVTSEASAARLRSCARQDGLPLALVALDEQGVCGTVTLRWDSITSRPSLGPWLAALYVMPAMRRHGVGARLVRSAEAEASRLGFSVLYTGTSTAKSLFSRLGWAEMERLEYCGESLVLYQRTLAAVA